MTDRPLIFSGPEVRALLEGRKTQDRRVIKPQPRERYNDGRWYADRYNHTNVWCMWGARGTDVENKCGDNIPVRYEVGDRLWVRESWWHDAEGGDVANEYGYLADEFHPCHGDNCGHVRHRPSIHMPRWASRLTLIVTEVRVQRLQDISEEDAKAEGVEPIVDHGVGNRHLHAIAFEQLWNRLHGPGSWEANPWVAALTFTVHPHNIDALEAA